MRPGSTWVAMLIGLAVFAGSAHASAQAAPASGASAEAEPAGGGKAGNPWTIPGFTLAGAALGGGVGGVSAIVYGLIRTNGGEPFPMLVIVAFASRGMLIGAAIGMVAGLAFGVALFTQPSSATPQTPPQPPPQLPPEIALRPPGADGQASVSFRF